MSRYPLVHLRDALTLADGGTGVDPDSLYRLAGVLSFGRGLFAKPEIRGSETTYRVLHQLHRGQFVVARLNAWEGAVAVVSAEFDQHFVSQEFPTFNVDESAINTAYLSALCSWPRFWRSFAENTQGSMVRRKRVHPDRILDLRVPLPDLDEQRRVADRLDRLESARSRLRSLTESTAGLVGQLRDSVHDGLLSRARGTGAPVAPLSSFAEINPDPQPLNGIADTLPVTFIPMRALDERRGVVTAPEKRLLSEVRRGYKQFGRGDVIFARITPCMQNGKSAVVVIGGGEVAFGSTEFHVLRSREDVLPDWLHFVVRSRAFRDQAAATFKGTAGQLRVSSAFMESVHIPVPRTRESQEEMLNEWRRWDAHLARMEQLSEKRVRIGTGLRASLLDRAFAGEL